jgi:Zn-dependent protease with chaperone function
MASATDALLCWFGVHSEQSCRRQAEEPPWPLIIALVVLVPEIISFLAFLLNRSRIGAKIPDELEGIYDPKEYETSISYTKAKSDFKICKDIFDLIFFFGFWFLKGFPLLDSLCVQLGWSEIPTGLVFLGLFGLIFSIVGLPFDVYSTFVLEERYGFNKTTRCTFVKDRLKGLVLGVLIGAPLLSVILWFFITFRTLGWLYVYLTVTVFQLVLLFLMPVYILPLFLEMTPLPEGIAFITEDNEKAGSRNFLTSRVFYAHEKGFVTKDRRFQGSSNGATLSIYAPQSGVHADAGNWVLAEGEPGAEDAKVYATSAIIGSEDCPGISSSWVLTEEGKSAIQTKRDGEETTLLSKDDPMQMTRVDVGTLRKDLLNLADRLGYHGASIFVIDGSARSAHSNAFCIGFGRFRRICLFDTLLPLMEKEEIVAVLGHEIGHDRLYHVHTTMVITFAYLAVQLYALGSFITSKAISSAFFVPEPKVYLGLALFSIVWGVVDFVFSIPLTVQTRMNEYAADRYSVDADMSHSVTLASALKKLMKKSKVNLTPHPFHVFLTYSHPPLDTRLQAIRAYAATKK